MITCCVCRCFDVVICVRNFSHDWSQQINDFQIFNFALKIKLKNNRNFQECVARNRHATWIDTATLVHKYNSTFDDPNGTSVARDAFHHQRGRTIVSSNWQILTNLKFQTNLNQTNFTFWHINASLNSNFKLWNYNSIIRHEPLAAQPRRYD